MVDATRPQKPGPARVASILGGPSWEMPSGLLAAHALAVSAVHVATRLITIGIDASAESRDLDLICNLAAELRPLAAELDGAPLSRFNAVGVVHQLPDGHGSCTSTHAAVRVVLADVRTRLEPILTTLGLLSDTEPAAVLANRARDQGRTDPFGGCFEQLVEHYHASLLKHWAGWATVERTLVAEVAAAGRAGLVPAEGGGTLDQARFDAAITHVLNLQRDAERQYLFARWRMFAAAVRHMRVRGVYVPSLRDHRAEVHALGLLTAEVLSHVLSPTEEAAALLELVDVLRELRELTVREDVLFERGGTIDLDADLGGSVRAIVTETLPRVLRAAAMEVDRVALYPAAAPPKSTLPPEQRSGNVPPQVDAPGATGDQADAVAGNGASGAVAQAASSSGDSSDAAPAPRLDRHQNGPSRDREPSAMQLARWRDILLALPASDRIAMDGSGALLNKLRARAAEARTRERIAVRHDKDSLRRDLVSLRALGWVDAKLLIRTVQGDAEAKQPM